MGGREQRKDHDLCRGNRSSFPELLTNQDQDEEEATVTSCGVHKVKVNSWGSRVVTFKILKPTGLVYAWFKPVTMSPHISRLQQVAALI